MLISEKMLEALWAASHSELWIEKEEVEGANLSLSELTELLSLGWFIAAEEKGSVSNEKIYLELTQKGKSILEEHACPRCKNIDITVGERAGKVGYVCQSCGHSSDLFDTEDAARAAFYAVKNKAC